MNFHNSSDRNVQSNCQRRRNESRNFAEDSKTLLLSKYRTADISFSSRTGQISKTFPDCEVPTGQVHFRSIDTRVSVELSCDLHSFPQAWPKSWVVIDVDKQRQCEFIRCLFGDGSACVNTLNPENPGKRQMSAGSYSGFSTTAPAPATFK